MQLMLVSILSRSSTVRPPALDIEGFEGCTYLPVFFHKMQVAGKRAVRD